MEEEYIILNTASFARDFEFFSEHEPDYGTLKKRYGANLDSKRLVIEIADGRFNMFLSKIPGNRADEKGRYMFYNIVAKGRTGGYRIATAVRNIAAAAITDIQQLGEKFDQFFTSDYLRKFDDCRKTTATQKAIQTKLLELADNLDECYASNYEIDEKEIKILVKNPNNNFDESEPIEESKDRMIKALNFITDYHPNPDLANGIVVFLEFDTLYKNNVKEFDEFGATPLYGYILVNENKTEAKSIAVKKKLKSESLTATFRKKLKSGWMPIATTLLIISLIANLILLMLNRSTVKSETALADVKDSTALLESLISQKDSLILEMQQTIDSINNASKTDLFFDETNKNNIELDINEFRKNGWFKSFVCHSENDSLVVNDTIIIRSNVDFVKGICYINIHKTSCQTPPFIQVPFSLIGENHKQELTQGKDKKQAAKTTNR